MSKAPKPHATVTPESPSTPPPPPPETDTDPVITCVEYMLALSIEPSICDMEKLPPASSNRVTSELEVLPPNVRDAVLALLDVAARRKPWSQPLC